MGKTLREHLANAPKCPECGKKMKWSYDVQDILAYWVCKNYECDEYGKEKYSH